MKLFIAIFAIIAVVAANEPSSDYLPPAEEVSVEGDFGGGEESAAVADDGYRYKTVRRLKYRHRRDVSELSNDYLPPQEESLQVIEEHGGDGGGEESAVLADDGYRYKTVRRRKYRHRRDVSEIANDYLPPHEESVQVIEEHGGDGGGEESAVLADDGYRYKTVRRRKYRHRRDVGEIANDYLPPHEESVQVIEEHGGEGGGEESAVLADDGYRYKTVRRRKYRHRRDVSEIANDYLPPHEESLQVVEEHGGEGGGEESAVLADDGYRYKTVRRRKYRHRRDVSEIANDYLPPSNDYLPPVHQEHRVAVAEHGGEGGGEESAVLGDDGYRYKTVRRLRYRHRRV